MDHFSLEKPFGDRSTIRKHILFSLFFFAIEGTIMLKHNRSDSNCFINKFSFGSYYVDDKENNNSQLYLYLLFYSMENCTA